MVHLRTDLHDLRLEAAARAIVDSGARSVLDLGCGAGALLRRLVAEPQLNRIVGVDKCASSLGLAREALQEHLDVRPRRLSMVVGSYTDRDPEWKGFDACAMVETIEHIDPGMLGSVEQAVFGFYRPKTLVMTTPNAEFNEVFGLGRNEFREPDHRFEWDRGKFRAWATGIAKRHRYAVTFSGVGETDLLLGQPTQMGLFHRLDSAPMRK